MNLSPTPWMRRISIVLIVLCFTSMYYRTAWVADDAFITFRVIENWIAGYGLRWNIDERVQVYTHPLWMFLSALGVYFFDDVYWVSIGLSYVCLIFFIFALLRIGSTSWIKCIALVFSLFWSRAFCDYSSSGLENPLTHLLLAIFFMLYIKEFYFKSAALIVIATLIYLNRPDASILVVPAVIWNLYLRLKSENLVLIRLLSEVFWGLIIFVAWLTFSIFYYGTFVPNTAIAKVGNGLDFFESVIQAWNLISFSWDNDIITVVIVAAALLVSVVYKKFRVFGLGLILWVVALAWIGGDYMGGRFLSAPVALSILVLVACDIGWYYIIGFFALLVFNLTALKSTLFSSLDYRGYIDFQTGVADERGVYYEHTGLRKILRTKSWRDIPQIKEGEALGGFKAGVFVKCNIGMAPFGAGPLVTFIDPLALSEPFLARVPARSGNRVGHYERAFPEGFLISRVSLQNKLEDPQMRMLWQDVDFAARRDLFSFERMAAIIRLNFLRQIYKTENFDKENVGLPGIPVNDKSKFSCLGQAEWKTWYVGDKK